MAGIPRLRRYGGIALLSYGFRPFFLFGSIFAGLAILIWLPLFYGRMELPSAFSPRDWHVHEMLYGFVPAAMTGFLLTAIPNWTGRLPIQGAPLLSLFMLWLAGRVAILFSEWIGWGAAAVDMSFLAVVAAAAAREIVAGRNWRNLKVVVIVSLFAMGNLLFHLEAHFSGAADHSIRLGVAVVVLLITLVGGRIVPSFTRNWLARRGPGRLPRSFGRFDLITMAMSVVALAFWIVMPFNSSTATVLVAAGLLQLLRLATWAGDRTFADQLVLILHVGYAFIPLGFFLMGCAALGAIPVGAGIHAWTGGAVGTMVLAVMTRATLGHTGQALMASKGTQAIYAAVVVSAFVRIGAGLHPEWSVSLLALSAITWAVAFLGYAAIYAPVLCNVRLASINSVRKSHRN